MRKLGTWAPLACAALLAACGGTPPDSDGGADAPPMVDGGRDGGNVCSGRTLCPTAGTSCDGDDLVTCAADADGCLVATRSDCGAAGDVCDATGGTAACVDVCSLVPAADRCDTDGARACEGDTLEVCTMNAAGCLVLERTECDAASDGACDASGDMPVCVLPADPCDAIPAADRCATAGTSCDGDALVECALNAFGCLVTQRTDCSERADGTCEASGGAAECTFTGDPCDGIAQCTTPGARCDGPELVECAADAFGCVVETRTACTDAPFGFCDAEASPAPVCSTAAVDPCMGVTQCGASASRTCADEGTLEVCAANAFGCFVTTTTSCTTDGDVCSAASGTAMCVDPCSLIDTCPAATYCDGDDVVTCAPNAAGCLIEDTRSACDDTCDLVGGASECVETACPEAEAGIIDCESGTITGDTAAAPNNRVGYAGCTTLDYPGGERIYRFRHRGPTPVEVRMVATRLDGTDETADYDLFAWQAGDGFATSCTGSPVSCLDSSTGVSAIETIDFVAQPGDASYIGYDRYSSGTTTTRFTIDITCTPIVCGDGVISGDEQCDDGNTASGDGCSETCTREPGYACSEVPSTCTFVCGNGVIDAAAGETCDDGNTMDGDGCSGVCRTEEGYTCVGAGPDTCTMQAPNAVCSGATTLTLEGLNDHDLRAGGPRPTGASCGTSPGPVRYYQVTVPALTRATVTATPIFSSWDVTLRSLDDCSGACVAAVNAAPAGGAESISLTNATGTAAVRYVAVGASSATDFGRYDLSVSTTALPPNSTCATATVVTSDTAITGENARLGGPRPTGTGCGGGTGATALYYSVTVPPGQRMRALTALTGGGDIVLFTVADCDATTCLSQTDTAPEQITISNTGAEPLTRIIGIRPYSTASVAIYDISFTYTVIATPAHATCEGARVVTASTSFMSEDTIDAGAPPAGTVCGSSGGPTLYYNIAIPPAARVTASVTGTGTFNAVLKVLESCGASDCLSRTDATFGGGTETVSLTNTTDATINRILAVNSSSATGAGVYGVTFGYATCGNGVVEAGETCDDGGTTAGDGCSATCTVETGWSCAGAPSTCTMATYTREAITAACVDVSGSTPIALATGTSDDGNGAITPLPFSFPFFGASVSHYAVSTNGLVQVYTSSTGTPSPEYFNAAIPSVAVPNGFIAPFWDDLHNDAGGIRAAEVGGRFVIEWISRILGETGPSLRFQAQVLPTGVVELHYCAALATTDRYTGNSATIGLENLTGTAGSQQSFNTAGAAVVGSGYRFTP